MHIHSHINVDNRAKKKRREQEKYKENIYQLYSVLTAEFLFTMVDDDNDNVELS